MNRLKKKNHEDKNFCGTKNKWANVDQISSSWPICSLGYLACQISSCPTWSNNASDLWFTSMLSSPFKNCVQLFLVISPDILKYRVFSAFLQGIYVFCSLLWLHTEMGKRARDTSVAERCPTKTQPGQFTEWLSEFTENNADFIPLILFQFKLDKVQRGGTGEPITPRKSWHRTGLVSTNPTVIC